MRARALVYVILYVACAEVAWRADFMAELRGRSFAFWAIALHVLLRVLLLVCGPPLIAFILTKSAFRLNLKSWTSSSD